MRLWPVLFRILSNQLHLLVNPLFDGNLQYLPSTRPSNQTRNYFVFNGFLIRISARRQAVMSEAFLWKCCKNYKTSLFEPGSKTTTISCKTFSSILFSWWDGNFLTSANHVSCYFICLYSRSFIVFCRHFLVNCALFVGEEGRLITQ